MTFPQVTIALPSWVEDFVHAAPRPFSTPEERMRFVIALSRKNIQEETGGPFGAAVFDAYGNLVAPGVNLVMSADCSILHAEMVAFAVAQKALNRFDIGNGGTASYELYASTEPCVMCFGAVFWSGVTRLVCGARDEDARRIGFDEGPKLTDWAGALKHRGIDVIRDCLRTEAAEVLKAYVEAGGMIYNSGPAGA